MDITGTSIAGVETCVEVPSFKLALDMGRCTRTAVNHPVVLVSHGHLDHCGALPQHAARRAMMNMEVGTYVVPADVAPQVEQMFNAAGALDGNPIPRRVVPLRPGEEFPLSSKRFVRAFPTFHRVVSQGYTVWERRTRLKAQYAALPQQELGALARSGAVLSESHDVPVLSFTGDTRVEVLEQVDELRYVETLVMEASFLDERVSVAQAREMGHVHLDEVLDRRALLTAPRVVLFHFSARYDAGLVQTILAQRVPEELRARISALV